MLCCVVNNVVQTVFIFNFEIFYQIIQSRFSVFVPAEFHLPQTLCISMPTAGPASHYIQNKYIKRWHTPTSHNLNTGKHTKYQNLISKFVELGISAFKTRLSTDKKNPSCNRTRSLFHATQFTLALF